VLSVTIAAPTGYLGATVTVKPGAQIDSAEGAAAGTTTSGSETFIDGYLAQAGTAVLPELNAGVSGVLRDAATGAVIANAKINLDITNGGSAAAVGQEATQNAAVSTSYAVSTYSATTDANGKYSFVNIPSDSTFTAYVPGYALAAGPLFTGFNTNTEDMITQADSTVNPIVSVDTVSPFVVGVTNVILGDTDTFGAAKGAMLDDDTRNTFTINFSEVMDLTKVDDNSVIVKSGATRATMIDQPVTVTKAADNLSITVSTAADLTDATLIDINLLVADFEDTAKK
jgi:hypothetical protein